MGRTIRFRGKRLDNGEWVYGDLVHDDKGGVYVFPLDAENLYTHFSVFPETVGQFTGLVDKNGNEIYEGDIISFLNGYKCGPKGGWVDNVTLLQVYYRNSGFSVSGLYGVTDKISLLGNQYDNPDLLEQLKQ